MNPLETLIACAGHWQGSSRLIVPEFDVQHDSPATAIVTPLLAGKFVRLDYTWEYEGLQEGSMLFGYQVYANTITLHWIDGWHNNDQVMACRGVVEADGAFSVLGSYSAPAGRDWGWRTVIRAREGQSLQVVMYNISPDEQEMLAVEAAYQRA